LHANIYNVHSRFSIVSPDCYHSTPETLVLYPAANLTFLSQLAAVLRLTPIMIAVKLGFQPDTVVKRQRSGVTRFDL